MIKTKLILKVMFFLHNSTYYEQLQDRCSHKETDKVSIFLKPMEPDGVLFAFNGEVASQLFCKDNTLIGNVRKLNGSGIMQLPTGCTLSVTNEEGQNTKLNGRPTSRMNTFRRCGVFKN